MAERSLHSPDLEDATPELERLVHGWSLPLQQGLQLEADRGFTNLQGRQETFAAFLRQQLDHPPVPLRAAEQERLSELRAGYSRYESLGLAQRQRLVRQSREWLLALRRRCRPQAEMAPPRLRLASPTVGMAKPIASSDRGDQAGLAPALDTPLAQVRGIGPRTAARLAQLDLWVVRDLLRHYPRDYLDYANLRRISALEPGETATIVATVRRAHAFVSPRNPNLSILELQLQDPTGRLRVSRFSAGRRFTAPAWLKSQQRQFPPGAVVAVSGLVKQTPYGPAFSDPLMEVLDHAGAPVQSRAIGRLLPVYSLTEGLGAERLRQAVAAVLPALSGLPDPLPAPLRLQEGLMPLAEALQAIHQPSDQANLSRARARLVFDEFLLLQLGLAQRRRQLKAAQAPVLDPPAESTGAGSRSLELRFFDLLPFALTGAQQRVLAEIRRDLARHEPMARLVQGDVGSGKTVVALAALLVAIESGCQGALMAPTEVLAQQHFHKITGWLNQLHVTSALLTGSTPARQRRRLLEDLANGQLQLLVGTHALLEDPVAFDRLGLVVVDEQHRFGVNQRNRLLAKGLQPHLLTMTATPIPRTLALSLHGDLDVSQIDELPPGRRPISTLVLRGSGRDQAYERIRSEVARGQRAYVVLPLVEESEKLDVRSAVEVHAHLSDTVFPEFQVGLLHGRLSSEAKQQAIEAFAAGTTQVLVSTTVVEVGVDVPAATVMVIEHAERFGLAQLHQLRGRVGRGAAQSYCLLINDSSNALARQRLELLERSNDGFEIAEMDLRLRGPGQVLGTRQSGLPDLALASLARDGEVLERARAVAQAIVAKDPSLSHHPELASLLAEQRRRLSQAAVQLN